MVGQIRQRKSSDMITMSNCLKWRLKINLKLLINDLLIYLLESADGYIH